MSTNQQWPSQKTNKAIYVCFILLIWLLLSPIMIHWTYQIWQNRQTIFMHKRHIYLSLACCVACIISTIINIPLDLHSFFTNIQQLYSLSHAIICGVVDCYIFCLLCSRFYMLFFDINWTTITLSSHWVIHIRKPASKNKSYARLLEAQNATPNYSAMTPILPAQFNKNIDVNVVENWFIKQRSKYGSIKNVKRFTNLFFGVASHFYVALSVLIFATNQHVKTFNLWQSLVDLIFLLIPCTVIIYLWTKTPNNNINDKIFFFEEMYKLFFIIVTTCGVKLFLFVIAMLSKCTFLDFSEWYFGLIMANYIVNLLSCFSIVYYQTYWVMNEIKKQRQKLNDILYNDTKQLLLQDSFLSFDYRHSDFNGKLLATVLQHSILLDAFVKYLSTEYCMELMFAFIEFTQLKRLMERNINFIEFLENSSRSDAYINSEYLSYSNLRADSNININGEYDKYSGAIKCLRLPNTISRSSLVHNRKYSLIQGVGRYRKIAKKLSAKYMDSCSVFELPINKQIKQSVLNKLRLLNGISSNALQYEQYEIFENIYELFDECRQEIYVLLMHSCDRFIKLGALRQSMVVQQFGVDLGLLILSYLPSNGLY